MPCNQIRMGEEKMERKLFTSESVTEGHPDKVADQISDAILDAILTQDPLARVACETAVNTGLVLVFGEVTTTAYVDIQQIVRQTIREIGYDNSVLGFDGDSIAVLVALDEQSPDIALGVDAAFETREAEQAQLGAGDQGLMFGYACDETEEYMPLSIALSHRLTRRLSEVRRQGILPYLRPDGKAQVTIEQNEQDVAMRVETIVVSTQHAPEIDLEQLRQEVLEHVIKPVIPAELLDEQTTYYINPTGRFVIGGPKGDAGLTGRKIIVDTYGGVARHGGGAFSGKDATKVDRSASYMARYIAKNIVAAGFAKRCEVQLAYAIGVAQPVSVRVETFGTSNVSEAELVTAIRTLFDLTPDGIIRTLALRRPIYRQTAAYGHFGRQDVQLPWEQLNKVAELKAILTK